MSHCLLCDEELSFQVSWRYVFGLEREALLCARCEAKLEKIKGGERCVTCDRPLQNYPYQLEGTCYDCIRWEQSEEWRGVLTCNRSCFVYNLFMKEVIARWKYRSDAILAKIFQAAIKEVYERSFQSNVIVPIPLTTSRLLARGFNQSLLLSETISNPLDILIRTDDESKQSKKSRRARLLKKQPFKIRQEYKKIVQDADIILVDDIYTTGTTARLAAKVLREAGANSVSSLTAIRG